MAGRQWHWVAAGVAALAVFAAVLANDTTPGSTLSAQTFPTVTNYVPDNGGMIVATPSMDATTVTKSTTSTSQPAPPKATTPPPSSTSSAKIQPKPPQLTLPISLPDMPVYYPDCAFAWAVGAAPIDEDEPGYRDELDGDHDGTACERRH